jgi:hypothetical protein
LTFYTDYDDEAAGYDDLVDINEATRKNVIAYNLFDGGPEGSEVGLKYKASQMLTDTDKTYTTYKEYGDKIHHNIFLNHNLCSVMLRQDFVQFYNNILVGPHGGLSWGQRSTWRRWYGVFYNNTIIDSGYWSFFDDSYQPFEANEYQVNNIYANYDYGSDQYSYPFLWWWDDTSHDSANAVHEEVFDRNYIYNSISGDLFRVGIEITPHADAHFGSFTVAEYNSENSVTNYQKASSEGTDNLFESDSGADQYITRGVHVVNGSITVANGGVGTNHPYLSGVILPSYLGATNPDDHDWVAGVLALNATYMRYASGEPDWVEGSSSPSNTAPVATDDNATTDENLSVSIDVLANDSDADADALIIDLFDTTTANGGTITDNGAGTLIYTPAAGWYGTDTFGYTISDGNGGYDSASVTITVQSEDPPVNQYTLTTSTQGNGTIGLEPESDSYDEGTSVTITATPSADYQFDHWEGDVSGSANPLDITVTGDITVTAVFMLIENQADDSDSDSDSGSEGGCFISSYNWFRTSRMMCMDCF